MIINFKRIATLTLLFGIVLITVGADGSSKAFNSSQDGFSEKEWQKEWQKKWRPDDASGVSVYIADHKTVSGSPERRDIYILLDKNHVDKDTLIRVFSHYAEKYSNPVWLNIKAFSDREALCVEFLSSIFDGSHIRWETYPEAFKRYYGLPSDRSKWKMRGFYAWYWRDRVDEYFDYTPSPGKLTFDRVILRKSEMPLVKGNVSKPASGEIENQKDILSILWPQGDDVDARDEDGWPPLANALKYGMFDFARALIEKGADVNACAPAGQCPLAYAARAGFAELVEILIAKGAKVNSRDKFGGTALMEAAGHGKQGVVKILLKQGADINAKDTLGRSALMKAWGEPDNVDMVELLLKAGADIDAVDDQGDTALMYSVRAGRLNTVKLLLKWGAKADTKNVRGQTAMDYAKISEISKSASAKDIIRALQQALAK